MKKTRYFLLSLVLVLGVDAKVEYGALALHQATLDLGTNASLMCVAAHPDDEDDGTLAMYCRKYGVRTIAVIATRGEGGQNEIGPELYNDLGVIRTREMMRSSNVLGADLHFLNLPEFGYSKSPEETFAIWGKDETVRRLVRVIRQTQPTVIISNHGTQKDHGHHQALGMALREAFHAAGDATRFPELESEGLKSWQPLRLYLRAWQPNADAVKIEINELDEARGKTYAAIAAEALGEHKSQGMGFFIDRYLLGTVTPAYVLESSAENNAVALQLPAEDAVLFAGLPGDRRALDATQAIAELAERDPARHAELALHMRLNATPSDTLVVPGQAITVHATISDYEDIEAESVAFAIQSAEWFNGENSQFVESALSSGGSARAEVSYTVPAQAPLTVPEGEHLFDPHFMAPQLTAVARVKLKGKDEPVILTQPIALQIAPRVSAEVVNSPLLVRRGAESECAFDVLITNHAAQPAEGRMEISVAPGFQPENTLFPFALSRENEQRIVSVPAKIADNLEPRDYLVNAVIDGDVRPSFGVARLVDLSIPENKRVGVVQSYDNTFMNVLEKMGVPHESLTIEDFTAAKLDTFTSIIVDIRAYLVREDLVANNAALLGYVERGGALLVMYQKTEEWKPELAPYPITLSRNRVTREDAPVTMTAHPVFTTPNALTAEDWNGWIQERGLYFPSEWDARYTPLIECVDPGETIPPGALLVAQHGEGHYLYTALALYRQLRELHPGALRLFANMLAL